MHSVVGSSLYNHNDEPNNEIFIVELADEKVAFRREIGEYVRNYHAGRMK